MKNLPFGEQHMVRKAFLILLATLSTAVATQAQSQQDDFGRELQRKLSLYYDNNMPVALQLFFNQPVYSAGDTAWFNISFLTARELRPIAGRQIIQVYLTDRKGTPLLHQQVVTDEGFGANQIVIPASFSPGVYTVVAFGEGMKNHDPSFFYYSDLIVSGGKLFAQQTSAAISLYPEGGNFVSGVTNRVAVMANPGARISIRDGQEKEVATCVADRLGFASFYINPRPGERYKALDGITSTALPVAASNHAAIMLTAPAKEDPLHVVVQAGEEWRESDLYLVISAQDHIYYSVKMNFTEKKAAIINVPFSALPHGLAQATVFRTDGSVEAERLFFVKASTAQVTGQADREHYGTRNLVTLRIHSADKGQPLLSQLGIRVVSADLFPGDAPSDGQTLMAMQDLPYGAAAHAPLLKAGAATRDNLLIAQTWKRFAWCDVWKEVVKSEYKYKNYLYLTGHVKHDRPLPDSTQITFFLQHDAQAYFGMPDHNGNFDLPIFYEFDGAEEVFYRVERKGKRIEGVDIEIVAGEGKFDFSLPAFKTTNRADHYQQFAVHAKRIHAAYAQQKRQAALGEVDPNAWMKKKIFEADHTVDFSDFVLFPTMGETLREIVPSTMHRVHNKRDIVRVVVKDLNAIPSEDPVYVIDGVMTDNTNYFLSLKPENVATVKVICTPGKLHSFGAVGRNGVLLVETKLPDNAANIPRSTTVFSITGLNRVQAFHTPRPQEQTKRIPLLKSTLYWNPKVVTDKEGNATISFYTSDNTGDFKVQINGITASGEPVCSEARFSVGFKDAH